MSQAPVLPVWTDALIGDTTHLSAEEFGCYLLLLIATWRNGGQPFADEDARLARVCRVPINRWRARIRPVLVNFYSLADGHWRQKRLEKEWKISSEHRDKKRAAGEASALAKTLKKQDTPSTGVEGVLQQNGQQTGNSLILIQEEEGSVGSNEPTAADAAPARSEEPRTVVPLRPPPDPERELFRFGKEVLGKSAGGMIVQLRARCEGDTEQTMFNLKRAATKENPREYVGAIIRGERMVETDWDAYYARIGVRSDGTPFGDDKFVPMHLRPGDDGSGLTH